MPKAEKSISSATAARMIAVRVPRRSAREPLLINAAETLAETLETVRTAIDNHDNPFRLVTTVAGVQVQPTESAWATLLAQDTTLRVFDVLSEGEGSAIRLPSQTDALGNTQIFLRDLVGRIHTFDVDLDDVTEVLKAQMRARTGMPYGGKLIENGRSLREYGIRSRSTLHLVLRLRGGKPVIHILSPTELHGVCVNLGLVPSWSISAVWPVVEPTVGKDGASTIRWTVDVKPDGTLTDKATGSIVDSLFWEAETDALAKSDASLPYDPAHPIIDPSNSVVLPFADVLAYIETALVHLKLSVAMRTNMITYWLPALLKHRHRHVALRFLPQADLDKAAPLKITPSPDVTVRVYLLFAGVDVDDASWAVARKRASVVDWRTIVGADWAAFERADLLRVVEWGGCAV